jgi:hypothetical protein
VVLRIDPELAAVVPGAAPPDWATRAMFVHPRAGAIWAQRSAEPEAFEGLSAVVALYADLLCRAPSPFRCMLSLGAGAASVDKRLVEGLVSSRPTYIPVDLSADMCEAAMRAMSGVCDVPLGIVADFESCFAFVANMAAPVLTSPALVCCTGNAIGNLDRGEQNFFANVRPMMRSGDFLLVSFATGRFPQPMTRAVFDAAVGWNDLRELLACAVETITGEAADAVAPALDSRLLVARGFGDAPQSDALRLVDSMSGRTLLHLRRYHLGAMRDWIATRFGMHVVAAQEIEVSSTGVGIGALLATPAPQSPP